MHLIKDITNTQNRNQTMMSSIQQQPFLSSQNYQKITGFLRQHYAQRMGVSAIPERIDTRIQKTVQHYMTEVAKVGGNSKPISNMNQDVLRESISSMDQWFQKQDSTQTKQTIPSQKSVTMKPSQRSNTSSSKYDVSMNDMNRLFEFQGPLSSTPQSIITPDFHTSSPNMIVEEDDDDDPLLRLKRIQKERDDEMKAVQQPLPSNQTTTETAPQALPPPIRAVPLQQDYIIPQEDVVKYREVEYNVFLTSGDRDWLRNKGENRYNFSVMFNPGNTHRQNPSPYPLNGVVNSSFGLSAAIMHRFKNIIRIEFVKALLPTESLTTLVRVNQRSQDLTVYNTDRVINVFSYPFVGVRIAELNNNGFSTSPNEDNTFAIIQYDSTWASDITNNPTNPPKTTVGYTGFIPKFLKCQKEYTTPLTSLQKLSLRIERHDGELLSQDPDVLAIRRICLSKLTTGIVLNNISLYKSGINEYIFIQTNTYFPSSAIAEGDLIRIQGYIVEPQAGFLSVSASIKQEFSSFINREQGHNVIATGWTNTDSNTIMDGTNKFGYSNIIVIRAPFEDPTTGSTARQYFGGNAGEEDSLGNFINIQTESSSKCGLINLSRQTHVVLRIITREFDSASNIRTDNV